MATIKSLSLIGLVSGLFLLIDLIECSVNCFNPMEKVRGTSNQLDMTSIGKNQRSKAHSSSEHDELCACL